MSLLRVTIRFVLYVVLTSVFFLVWAIGTPLAMVSEYFFRRWHYFWFRSWAQVIAHVFGVKFTIIGRPPDAPFVLVSNHLGYLDIVLLATQVEARFVAKKEIESWPFIGFLAKRMGTVFVDRERKRDVVRLNQELAEQLEARQGVVIFPEGTSSGGSGILPFKSGGLAFAARHGAPVHVASISYRTRPPDPHASTSVCWWGGMEFLGHFLDLMKLREIRCTIVFESVPLLNSNRKTLAVDLRRAVESIFTPVITEEALCTSHPR
jgi:1-acyl-sn-glycerol-3-phosphate acyltransferase